MQHLSTVTKDPESKLAYGLDWGPWLPEGEAIQNSTWQITPTDELINEGSSWENGSTVCTIWLAAGQEGMTYRVTNQIVTDGGSTDRRSFDLRIQSH